jgi:protein-tyrosine phosphatase
MRRRWWRSWPFLALSAALLTVGVLYLVAVRLNHEEPNYSRIEDGLYLGGTVSEPPPGVKVVLNLRETEDPYQVEVHKWSPIPDREPAPSLDWLREQVEFIDAQRRAGRPVFVHCQAGISRSAMVVIAYEMSHHGWTRDEALAFVRSKRSVVRPNPAFMQLLLEWERLLRERAALSLRARSARQGRAAQSARPLQALYLAGQSASMH